MHHSDIKYIVIHCSATKPSQDHDVGTIRQMHKARGFNDVGYHFIITRDGNIQLGRDMSTPGAHANMISHGGISYNRISWAVCMVGGIGENGKAEDNYTPAQWKALDVMVLLLKAKAPDADVVGHRDLSPDRNSDGTVDRTEWVKECPCFNVRARYPL